MFTNFKFIERPNLSYLTLKKPAWQPCARTPWDRSIRQMQDSGAPARTFCDRKMSPVGKFTSWWMCRLYSWTRLESSGPKLGMGGGGGGGKNYTSNIYPAITPFPTRSITFELLGPHHFFKNPPPPPPTATLLPLHPSRLLHTDQTGSEFLGTLEPDAHRWRWPTGTWARGWGWQRPASGTRGACSCLGWSSYTERKCTSSNKLSKWNSSTAVLSRVYSSLKCDYKIH